MRELENVIERAAVLAEPRAAAAPGSLWDEIDGRQADEIREPCGARAARMLGIPRTTLNDRIRRHGIGWPR